MTIIFKTKLNHCSKLKLQQKTDRDEINVKISCFKWTIAVKIYLNLKPSHRYNQLFLNILK